MTLHVLEPKSTDTSQHDTRHWVSWNAVEKHHCLPHRVAMLLVDGQDLLTRSASGCLGILYLRQDNSDGNLRLRYQTLISRCQLYTGDPDSSVGPADSRDTAQGMEQAGLVRQCSDKFWGGEQGTRDLLWFTKHFRWASLSQVYPQEQWLGSGRLFKSLERNNIH